MWILLLVSSLIASPEEWLVESSTPAEYTIATPQPISQSEAKNDELTQQKPHSKRLKAKKASRRTPK